MLFERLPEDKEKEVIERIARKIVSYGLEVPAVLFLELHKPLANIVGHSLLFAFPFLAPFLGVNALHEAGAILSTGEGIEALIRRIEELAAEKSSGNKSGAN
ncbi:MAG: hypothetical protein RMK18_08510 [Armatimonadota bacterium]|nr:hypothetical protein [Armatimonadota bacterium]MCX7777638.1 hypothetical protein [Armatimonadota bacterium]MDW8025884.1 hypothetical protein [Armatimonadota bacterium]